VAAAAFPRPEATPRSGMLAVDAEGGLSAREVLWERCRNSLGIARLLVHEGRPEPLVATACLMAVETACRAALEHAGYPFDGDIDHALERLGVPPELLGRLLAGTGSGRLAAAECIVASVACYLRSQVPERSWRY
jgi:hypothetical protein